MRMMSFLYFHSIIKKRINHIFSSEFSLVFFMYKIYYLVPQTNETAPLTAMTCIVIF